MIKILGTLDILTAILFWASILFPIPAVVLGILGVYLLAKGLVFVGFGLDFFSLLDIISGFVIITSGSLIIHPILISIISIYLIVKGVMSLA